MKKIITAIIATTALAAPLAAQSAEDQRRWDYAQERYRSETARYQAERDRYSAIARADRGRYGSDPYATSYDASRDYRDDPAIRSAYWPRTTRSIAARTGVIIASAAMARPA